MTPHLPWGIAAALLGAVTVGHWLAVRRPLGVSGVLGRFAALAEERRAEREAAAVRRNAAALEAALLAATTDAAEAGDLRAPAEAEPARRAREPAPVPPLSAHAVFLAALAAGGLLARVLSGGLTLEAGLPGALVARLGAGGATLALAAGGALVGFGTAACGGCSAGHGLTGCARLSPGSLAATATFFGAAVATSFLLGGLP